MREFDDPEAKQQLIDLNEELVKAERNGNVGFFEKHLADDLIFRRANGTVVTKAQFIEDLRSDAFDLLEGTVREVKVHHDAAVVTVIVRAKRKGDSAEAEYLNVRAFVQREDTWQIIRWLNTKVTPA